jgi:hypothetical protein
VELWQINRSERTWKAAQEKSSKKSNKYVHSLEVFVWFCEVIGTHAENKLQTGLNWGIGSERRHG